MTTWRWCFWRWSREGPSKWTAATLMFWILRQDLPKTPTVSGRVVLCRRIGPILLTSVGCRHWSFSVHLIDLLSILLRCHGFARMQKAVVDQTSHRPPNSDHDLFWCKFRFGKCSGASSRSNHWAGCRWLSYKIHFSSHITIQSRNGSLLLSRIREDNNKMMIFFDIQSSHEVPTYWAFSPFQFILNAEWPYNGWCWVLQQLLVL